MDPFVLHGDVEALIVDILTNHTPELIPYAPTISTDLRGYTSGDRWIQVTAEGGANDLWNVISKPRIDFDVRAEAPRRVAHDIAQVAFASIFRAVPHSAFGETMSAVKTELGLTKIPDKEEVESYRYLFRLRLTCLVDSSHSESF